MSALVQGIRAAPADDSLAQEHLAEYREHVAGIRKDLLVIAKESEGNGGNQLTIRVLRSVHSIRGAAFFGFVKISELAQEMEDCLALFLTCQILPKPYQVGILLRAAERLSELIQDPAASNTCDTSRILAAVSRVLVNVRPAAPPPGTSPQSTSTTDSPRPRFLAVDDDASSRLLLKTFLSRFGECDTATNGREAVAAYRSAAEQGQRYDLICIDIMMPEMGGREALRQVRALEEGDRIAPAAGAKIVMMTAVDDLKEIVRCFEDFSDAYLIKPISVFSLLRHLKRYNLAK